MLKVSYTSSSDRHSIHHVLCVQCFYDRPHRRGGLMCVCGRVDADSLLDCVFLRLYIYRSDGDEEAYRRTVDIYVDIAKAYAKLAAL